MAKRMGILERILRLDRRWVFIMVALSVALPLVFPLRLPVKVSEPVERLYHAIDKLPPSGRPILLSVDYDPSTVPELRPMTIAVLHHCFKKRIPVVVLTLHPAGPGLAEDALKSVAAHYPQARYGKDYAFLGYAPGVGLVILGIGQDFQKTFPSDAYGTPISQIPLLAHIRSYRDIEMVVDFTASALYEAWIGYAYQRYGCRVGAGVTAVMASDAYPYLQSGQLVGLLGGLSGAAEYETLVGWPGSGQAGMDAQSIVHLLIIALIIIGNVAYFTVRRKKRLEAESKSAI